MTTRGGSTGGGFDAPVGGDILTILVSEGHLTEEQAEQTRRRMRRSAVPAHQAILALGFASQEAVYRALSRCVGIPFVVLDRPNPLGGVTVAGPRIPDAAGALLPPVVHGLTVGELAEWMIGTGRARCRATRGSRRAPRCGHLTDGRHGLHAG